METVARIVRHADEWERRASLVVSYEAILSSPIGILQKLSEHLSLPLRTAEELSRNLQRQLAAITLAAGRKYTPPCSYVTGLAANVIQHVEHHFGAWLVKHNYHCLTCSEFWALATDHVAARNELWREFQQLSGRLMSTVAGAMDNGESAVRGVVEFCRRFGAPSYQISAVEILRLLCGGKNKVVECAHVELLLAQRKYRDAIAKARKIVESHDWSYARELLVRCESASPERMAESCDAPAASVLSEKTARLPLPPVSPRAIQDQNTVLRLAENVQGRTVGFLLHGSSINAFSDYASELVSRDVVWAGLNHFSLLEDRFLRPFGREFSLVFCCADGEVERRLPALTSFLQRPTRNLLITRPDHLAAFDKELGPHRDRIACELLPPLWPYPNSLTIFLRLLVQAGVRRIVLFGCDGYLGDDDDSLPTYVGAEEFIKEKRYSGVLLDTLLFNAHMPRILNTWRARLGASFPEILNCSPGTNIQGIPTIDYSQAAVALSGGSVTTGIARSVPASPSPSRRAIDDAAPEMVACLNAGRSGDLTFARERAFDALKIAPAQLTRFARRILQTDHRMIARAYHFLMLTGAGRLGSAEQKCASDLAREMRDTYDATGDSGNTWDDWE
jgi:hypothetical protein